jgi:hypothetical protein
MNMAAIALDRVLSYDVVIMDESASTYCQTIHISVQIICEVRLCYEVLNKT